MINTSRKIGFILVILGALFWGVSGTAAQKVFQYFAIEVNWLVTTRLLIAGFLLLTIVYFKKGGPHVFHIWKNKRMAFQLIVYGIFGMLAVQYTYMASINYGNAAVATLLQYLAPVMIIGYLFLSKKSKLTRQDFITVILALVGCFFLLTNGSISELSVPIHAIIWGVLSGVALAFYTLYAVNLLAHYDSLVIVGWAMIIGGLALSIIHPPWKINFTSFTIETYFYLFFIIIFGTMIAFWFYIESLKSLTPKETSLLGTLEPLAAVVTTVFWLKEPFGYFQWFGAICMLGMIVFLALSKEETTAEDQKKEVV